MFQLSSTSIDTDALRKDMLSPGSGAFNTFEGWVRDHNEGKKVTALEYEAYGPLCHSEAQKIIQEVRARCQVTGIRCVHRVGKLNIGELAVWIGVTAAHREDSFQACRYIIDELKARLPIWKKEYYVNEPPRWVSCQACAGEHTTNHSLTKA